MSVFVVCIFLNMASQTDFWSILKDKLLDNIEFNNENDCFIWVGVKKNSNGLIYGRYYVQLPSDDKAKYYLVHRLSLMVQNKAKLPTDQFVSHLCNRSLCINPNHLNVEPHYINTIRKTCFQFHRCNGHGAEFPNCIL